MRTLIAVSNSLTASPKCSFTLPGARALAFVPSDVHGLGSEPANFDLARSTVWPADAHPGVYPLAVMFPGEPEPLVVTGPNVYRPRKPFTHCEVFAEASLDVWRVLLLEDDEIALPGPLSVRRGRRRYSYAADAIAAPVNPGDASPLTDGYPVRGLVGWNLAAQNAAGAAFEVEVWIAHETYPSLELAGSTGRWALNETLSVSGADSVYREVKDPATLARVFFRPITAGVGVSLMWTPLYLG